MESIGVSVSPSEAHCQQGTIKSLIRVIKNTMRKLREEHPEVDPQTSIDNRKPGSVRAQSPLLRWRLHSNSMGIWL